MFRIAGPLAFRIGILLTILLGANSYIFIALYRNHMRDTVAPRLAAPIAAQIRALKLDLHVLKSPDREAWLAAFNAQPLPSIEELPQNTPPSTFPLPLQFLVELQGFVQQQAGADVRLGYRFDNAIGEMLLEFETDGRRYLLTIPGSGIQAPAIWPFAWLILSNATIVVLGVIFAIWQINRPLQHSAAALARSASELTEIEMPASAPAEFRVFAERFNRMAQKLKAQERERALLLAGVSHDLRAPLTRIRLRAELIDDEVPQMANGLIGDTESMGRIIDQFLDYQRTLVQTRMIAMDLCQRVGGIVARLRDMGRAVEFTPGGPVTVLADPGAIERILNNLIDNAFEYGAPPVEIGLHSADGFAFIDVRDHGKGIDPSEVQRLLQPFERNDRARNAQGHCGLGLSIVNRLVAELGGSLALTNHPAGGLVAQIRLPLYDEDPQAAGS